LLQKNKKYKSPLPYIQTNKPETELSLLESHGIVVSARPSVKAQVQRGPGSTPRPGQKSINPEKR